MGAEFWECYTPYSKDLNQALEKAQESVFSSGNYNSIGSKEEVIKSIEEAIANTQKDTVLDEEIKKHLITVYKSELQQLKSLPQPKSLKDKINELLIINQEAGTRSILDINGISNIPQVEKASPLTSEQLIQIFGTEMPTREMLELKKNELAELFNRLMAIIVTIYENNSPNEIYFAGLSAD